MTSSLSSAENMVAEPIDPTTAPRPSSAPAMAPAVPGATDEGKGDASLFNISSGTSSPFTSPDLPTRKRRGPRSSSPSIAWPFPGRQPSPVRPDLFERVVHRRFVTQEGDSTADAVKKIVEQLNADREYMEQLKDVIVTVNQRLDAQRTTTHEVRDWGEKAATSIIKLERRTQEDEASITKLQEAMKRVNAKVASLPDELGQTFDKRLPEVMNAYLKVLTKDVEELKQHVTMAARQQRGMGEYLQQLNSERPAEGRTVVSALQHLENEMAQIKNFVSQHNAGAGGGGDGVPQGQPVMNAKDGWKCHCDHVAYHEARINEIERTHAERINNLYENVVVLSGLVSGGDGAGAQGPGPCAPCGPSTAASSGCAAGSCGGCGGPGGGGGQQPPTAMPPMATPPGIPLGHAASAGGNGECHCRHVVELQRLTAELQRHVGELQARPARPDAAHDAWQQYIDRNGLPGQAPAVPVPSTRTSIALPLQYGPLGALLRSKCGLFDDKLTAQDEYKFDGSKGGDKWKGKVERYFISKVPALKNIFIWAEKSDMEIIDEGLFVRAVVRHDGMDKTQMELVNSAIWGFLSGCLGGEAETMFKQAEMLNGIDAWRRVVRYIDHRRSIRLETLRDEVRALHLKPIKNVEGVAVGIAEFENKIREYEAAGGKQVDEDEKKNDLLKILPAEISSALLWRASEPGGYQLFRDMVVRQSAKVMLNKRRLPVHAIEETAADEDDEEIDFRSINNIEDLVAAVQRMAGRGRGFGQRAGGAGGRRVGASNTRDSGSKQPPPVRRARRCPNCSQEHEGRCTKPEVPRNERTCWGCGKKDHLSRDCPEKKTKSVSHVNDDNIPIFGLHMVDNEGFTEVPRKKGRSQPAPRTVTMGDYINGAKFRFEALSEKTDAKKVRRPSTPDKESNYLDFENSRGPGRPC